MAYYLPFKVGITGKKTSDVIGVICVKKRKAKMGLSQSDKTMLKTLQTSLMAVTMVYQERLRYQQSEIIIREFVNKSSSR